MEQTQLVALAQGLAEQLRQEQLRTKEAEQRTKEAELRASAAKRAEVKAKSELGKQRAGWKQRKKKWLAYKVKHQALKVKYSRMQSIVHKEQKARAKGPGVSSPSVSAADAPPLPRDKNGGSTPPSQPPKRQPKKAPSTRKPAAVKIPAAALSALKAADSLKPSFPQPPEAAAAAAETERLRLEARVAESEATVQKKAKAEASRKAAAEEAERTAEKAAATEKAAKRAIGLPPNIVTSDTAPSLGRGERRTRASPLSSSVVDPKHPPVFHEVVRNKAARAKMDAVTSPCRNQARYMAEAGRSSRQPGAWSVTLKEPSGEPEPAGRTPEG